MKALKQSCKLWIAQMVVGGARHWWWVALAAAFIAGRHC